MDKKLKAKWIKALRSGRYKKGECYLRRGGRYCCIGVLCKIQRANFSQLDMTRLDIGPYAAGLNGVTLSNLADMNDGRFTPPRSFIEIADYIEKNL